MRWTRGRIAGPIGAVVAGLVAAVVVGPRPLSLPEGHTGDAALAAAARSALGDGHDRVAVALVEGDRVRYAGFGADERTPFEIGSVTKALTGMLLADVASDGAVELDRPVGPLAAGTPLAGGRATLRELAQHRSGLPRVPVRPGFLVRNTLSTWTGSDPYTEGPDRVLELAGDAGAPGGAEPAYSNLGAAALGDVLARQQRTTYGQLLRTRLLEPLGMRDTVAVTAPGGLPRGWEEGRSATSGLGQDPWIASGWLPAGVGTWSTAADLGTLARGVLDGTAPGASAATPTADYRGEDRIGLFWITSRVDGRTVTWHNGGTGGYSSYVGLDRDAGRAVVVLSASTAGVDRAAEELLTEEGR